jgi:hypothetical protein
LTAFFLAQRLLTLRQEGCRVLRLISSALATSLVLTMLIHAGVVQPAIGGVQARKIISAVGKVLDAFTVGLAALPQVTTAILSENASSLIGKTHSQVRAKIGVPTLVQDDIWYFDTPVGTLRVYFKNGVVSEVHPSNLRLGHVAAR